MANASLPNSLSSIKNCAIVDCNARTKTRGRYCSKHTYRLQRYGSPDLPAMRTMRLPRGTHKGKVCDVDGCSRPVDSLFKCEMHYRRWLVNGELNPLTGVALFWSRVAITANPYKCWLWQGSCASGGYGRMHWNGIRQKAHRIAFEIHNGYPAVNSVLHSCDTRACVNPRHLRDGTSADNAMDCAVRHRQFPRKLEEHHIAPIRELVKSGVTQTAVAEKYGVTHGCIGRICRRKNWAWVND